MKTNKQMRISIFSQGRTLALKVTPNETNDIYDDAIQF